MATEQNGFIHLTTDDEVARVGEYLGVEPMYRFRCVEDLTLVGGHFARLHNLRNEFGTRDFPRWDLGADTDSLRRQLHHADRRAARVVGSLQRRNNCYRASAAMAGASSATHAYALAGASVQTPLDLCREILASIGVTLE